MRRLVYWYREFLTGFSALVLATASIQGATTFTVTSIADPGNGVCTSANTGDGCTLREAIAAANSAAGDDTIVFAAGVTGIIQLGSVLPDLTTNMSITGPGPDVLTVRRNAGGTYRIFHVITTGFATFSGLTISDGTGGIINDNGATLTVTNCTINANATSVGLGGAIYNNSTGSVNVSNCTMSGNSASRGGAIFNNSTATVNVTDSTFSNNQSIGTSNAGGGGIYNNSTGALNITHCTFGHNSAIASGTNNGSGGGIYNEGGAVNVLNSTIEQNSVQLPSGNSSGGGIFNATGTVTVVNSFVHGNSVGGISGQNFGVNGSGGGISNESGTAIVINSTVNANFAEALGARTSRGAGIFTNTGTTNISNSTVSSNACGGFPSPTMVGGGVFNAAGTFTVKSTIIALNRVQAQDGTPGSNPDVSGTFTSQGFNLIGKRDGGTGFTQGTDQTGTAASPLDPKLDFIRDNGGPTLTVALLPGSPAIDKGTSHCSTCGLTAVLATDQRDTGFPRTFDDAATLNATGGDGTDIGAFEVQTSLVTRLANISTRLAVQTGDNVLIGGFIITGAQPKKVILRAIGPSLPFANKLANPTLELFGPSGSIKSNDNWMDSPDKQAIIDSSVAPSNDFESAIVATLPANNTGYTAIVRGANGGTGIGVVEAYDLDQFVDSKLANISTRGFVQTGDNVLIAGTIILGPNTQKVLVRGIGPSLQISGKMGDPTLELRNQNGSLLQVNDNWIDSSDKQAIIDTTIAPSDDFESAILATLPANGASYTAILRGANNASGIAVIEVYALQ
jgi:CSLREA domain-containing protein